MEVDDEALFFLRKLPSLDVGSEIVGPAQPAALSAAVEPSVLGEVPPAPMAVLLDVVHQLLVLLRRPWPFLHPGLIATRRSPHSSSSSCASGLFYS